MRLSATLVVLIFALIVLFGIGINMNNVMDDMPNCPFMGGTASVCAMNIFEHIAGWQQLFTVTQVFIAALVLSMYFSMTVGLKLLFLIKKIFIQKDFISKIFNYLASAFSNGILHPKVY